MRPSPSRAHANMANLVVLKGTIFEYFHSLWVHEAARAFEGATNARPGTLLMIINSLGQDSPRERGPHGGDWEKRLRKGVR